MTAIQAFARIPRVLALLTKHPDGLPIDVVATQIGVSAEQLRREIYEYYVTDILPDDLFGLMRPTTIDFVAGDDGEAEIADNTVLRAVSVRPEAEFGVEYLQAEHLAVLAAAARELSRTEPGNRTLAEAVAILVASFLPALGEEAPAADPASDAVAVLRRAVEESRSVRIDYSRQWEPGVYTRDVQPYELHHTRRGWELDAGPLKDGHPRTYLVDRIAGVDLLDEAFDRPDDIAALIADHRRPVTVELNLPQGTHWVTDRFAEATRVGPADPETMTLEAVLLPPVADRVGLILAIAGPDAFVVTPGDHSSAGTDLARRLLRHHGLD